MLGVAKVRQTERSAMSPVRSLPRAAEPLLSRFSIAFTARAFQRVLLPFVGSVLTPGRHTVTRAPWTVRAVAGGSGHFSDYHRVFSRASRYGGKRRRVEFVTGTGHGYRCGGGPVPLRRGFVHDADGTFSDAVAAVRRLLRRETILKGARPHEGVEKTPPRLREYLPEQLGRAA